tara:strand:+ start:5537 stop:5947 length:411 start_codon:yes stop_codon:yes gene_type:complete
MEDITKLDSTKTLFRVVEDVTGVTKEQILGKSRHGHIAIARSIVGYILYKEVGFTSTETGRILNRSHCTIVHYGKSFHNNYHYYEAFREKYVLVTDVFWNNFMKTEKEQIDLQLKSLNILMDKLKKRTNYLLTINN